MARVVVILFDVGGRIGREVRRHCVYRILIPGNVKDECYSLAQTMKRVFVSSTNNVWHGIIRSISRLHLQQGYFILTMISMANLVYTVEYHIAV